MCDSLSISHNQCNIPTLSDIHKKVIELNSIDLLDESKNQIFFDEISTIIRNISESYKVNNFDVENITDIIEEIFSIVFLLCENEQSRILELIPPLFILKSLSKSILSQFCIFLNHLKKKYPELEFDDDTLEFLNSTKKILIQAIQKVQPQIEFIDLLTNSKLYLTLNDTIEILSTILFLTDEYLDKSNLLLAIQFITSPFQIENKAPPFFIDFLSNVIKIGLIKEIESVLYKQILEMFDNEILLMIIEESTICDPVFANIAKIASKSKYQPLCNAIALDYIPNKISKHIISDNLILQIVNNCTIEQFNLEFWNEIGNLGKICNFHESIIERIISHFSDEDQHENEENHLSLQTVLAKLVFDPHSLLSHDEVVKILKESNDNIAINCILTINFNDDILIDPYFWHNYSQNFKRDKLYKNATQCFWLRYRQNQIKISDILFYSNIKPNENKCSFIQSIFDTYSSTFLANEPNMDQLIYENVTTPLFPKFWHLFKGYKIAQLYDDAPEDKKFFFYYGLCCDSGFVTPPIDVINFRQLTEESYEYLHSIIKEEITISFDSELPENIQSDLLFFISSTIMCSNIREINLIKEITFHNKSDFYLFLALLNQICSKENYFEHRIFNGKCIFDALEGTVSIITNEDCIKNINILFSAILKDISFVQSFERLFKILAKLIDVLWSQFKDADILSTFPHFGNIIYHLYSFYLRKRNDPYLNNRYLVDGFPKVVDHGIQKILFDCYKNSPLLEPHYLYTAQYQDISELLKNPTPELFTFLNQYLNIDYSKIKEDEFDENLIISSFLEFFNINQDRNKSINQFILDLSNEQIIEIINNFVDFTTFDSLVQLIIQEMPYNDLIQILSIEKYLQFIRKEVHKTLFYVLQQGPQHELFLLVNEYFQSHSEITISINPDDPNFLNPDDLNRISNSSLFDLDDILNSSFKSEKERISESILFLFKHTIHKLCKQEEIPNEIKTKLFLSSYQSEKNEDEEANFELIPTFESFSNLRNVAKFIIEEIIVLQKVIELYPFLKQEQKELINLISIENLPEDLKNQAIFIIRTCPSFRNPNFPILDILKMLLLNQMNNDSDNLFYNAIHLKLCTDSTGVLFYLHFLQSCSSTIKVNKDELSNNLYTHYLNTFDSFSCLEKAISKIFVSVEDIFFYYLDVDYSLLKKPSRQAIQFVRNNLLKGPFTNSYFQLLASVSLTYPDLMSCVFDVDECNFEGDENCDVVSFIKKLFPLKKADAKNIKEMEVRNILSTCTESVLYLISNFIKIPKLGDKVIQYFFDNLLDFDPEMISSFFHLLRLCCDCASVQTIIIGYLIRYNFTELVNQILEKISLNEKLQLLLYKIVQYYNEEKQKIEIITESPNKTNEKEDKENEEQNKDEEKEKQIDKDNEAQKQLTNENEEQKQLTNENEEQKFKNDNDIFENESFSAIAKRLNQKIMSVYENYQRSQLAVAKKEITESIAYLLLLLIRCEENEVKDSFGIAVMLSKREKPFEEFLDFPFNLSNDRSQWSPNFLEEVNHSIESYKFRSCSFIPITDSDKENLYQLIDNVETVGYDYRTPSDIPVEYFKELPDEIASKLIADRIPRLNTNITIDVYEILMKFPQWVSNWIIHRPVVMLLQQQYDIISNCIDEINIQTSAFAQPIKTPEKTFYSLTKQNFNNENDNEEKITEKENQITLNYKNICDFIYNSDFYNDKENRNLINTLFLYIASHKRIQNVDDDDFDEIQDPKEILIYYAKKMLRGTIFASNYKSVLFSFNPISNEIINDVIDVACSPQFRNNSDFLDSVLQFYKMKAFYRDGQIIENTGRNNNNNNNRLNLRIPPFTNNNNSNNDNENNENNNNNNNDNLANDIRIALHNNDIINIQYLLNHHHLLNYNNNNNNNNNSNNSNDDDDENNDDDDDKEEEEDYSDIDEKYRYDFFVILTMSESPKVLSSAFIYAPKHLIKASLNIGNCVSNAFLRCLNSKDIKRYTNFFSLLQNYKDFYVEHENQIIERIRGLLCNPDANRSQIIALFSMLSYQQISDPKKVCEEFYETLTPFWQLVYDARDFLSKALLEDNNLINTSFQFMKPVVHTLSFDFRVKYLKIFVRDLITTKTRSIIVRRENILEDSFKCIMAMSPNEFLGHISINFDGERGIDAGGLLRDWFTNLTKALFNENYALFVSSKVHGTFLPNPNSYVNGNHLKYFEFAGRIFARAIVEQINLEPHLALALRKKLLKYDLTIDDIEEFDPQLFESLKWILENDLSANPDFELYFTADTDNIGKHEVYELIENGAKTLVTNENKNLFVQKTIEYRTDVAIQDQSCAFCTGFFSIIPSEKIGIFTPEELDRIICGESFIDVDDWQKNCFFTGQFSINHPTIVIFFNVIKSWDQKDIAKLLYFITGSSQVPLGGFAAYKELGRPITIGSVDDKDKLITAHTCSNLLDLPIYDNETELNDKIRIAINECNSFDFH